MCYGQTVINKMLKLRGNIPPIQWMIATRVKSDCKLQENSKLPSFLQVITGTAIASDPYVCVRLLLVSLNMQEVQKSHNGIYWCTGAFWC